MSNIKNGRSFAKYTIYTEKLCHDKKKTFVIKTYLRKLELKT